MTSVIERTGGDNSKKACFGRKTKFFRESGDFAGNRETRVYLGNMTYFRDIFGKFDIFAEMSPKTSGGSFNFPGGLKLHAVLLKQRLLELSTPVKDAV